MKPVKVIKRDDISITIGKLGAIVTKEEAQKLANQLADAGVMSNNVTVEAAHKNPELQPVLLGTSPVLHRSGDCWLSRPLRYWLCHDELKKYARRPLRGNIQLKAYDREYPGACHVETWHRMLSQNQRYYASLNGKKTELYRSFYDWIQGMGGQAYVKVVPADDPDS